MQRQELDDPSEDISEILADDSSNESSLVSSTGSYEDVSQFGYEIIVDGSMSTPSQEEKI